MAKISQGLSAKESRFVDEYLIDLNATQAAIRAGFSKRSADVIASRLVRKPQVSEAIKNGIAERSKKTNITAEKVLVELAVVGFSSIENYVVADCRVLLAEGAPESAMRALSSVKTKTYVDDKGNTTTDVEYKLWPKVEALQLVARHLGMLVDKLQVGTTDDLAGIIIKTAAKRVLE